MEPTNDIAPIAQVTRLLLGELPPSIVVSPLPNPRGFVAEVQDALNVIVDDNVGVLSEVVTHGLHVTHIHTRLEEGPCFVWTPAFVLSTRPRLSSGTVTLVPGLKLNSTPQPSFCKSKLLHVQSV